MNFMSILRKKHSFSFVSPCKSKTTVVQVQGKSIHFLRISSHNTVHAYYGIIYFIMYFKWVTFLHKTGFNFITLCLHELPEVLLEFIYMYPIRMQLATTYILHVI